MKTPRVTKSMNYIDDDLISAAADYRPQTGGQRIWKRAAAIAACVALILSSLITVEATTGGISRLFALIWGGGHAEIVDELAVPLGNSASTDGYTMSVEAVLGDRYQVVMIYRLRRNDGQPIPQEGLFFDTQDYLRLGGNYDLGRRSLTTLYPSPDREDEVFFSEIVTYPRPIFGLPAQVKFQNLMLLEKNGTVTPVARGPWHMSFTLDYQDSTVELPTCGQVITSPRKKDYRIHRASVSSVGAHLELVPLLDAPQESSAEGTLICDWCDVSARTTDGRTIRAGFSGETEWFLDPVTTANVVFEYPVDVNDLDALIVNGTEIPIP